MTGTGRVRMRDRTGDDSAFGHQPPNVVWRCGHKARHRMLRVFHTPGGWHLMGDRIRLPLDQWLKLAGSTLTVDDLRDGKAEAMNARQVQGIDWLWPLDIDQWQHGRAFEVGCRCGITVGQVDWLADDARHARDTHKQVVRIIP